MIGLLNNKRFFSDLEDIIEFFSLVKSIDKFLSKLFGGLGFLLLFKYETEKRLELT